MLEYVNIINKTLSFGTIILQVLIVLIIINLIFLKKNNNTFLFFIRKNTLTLGFLVSLTAFLLSLFYSEVVGYPPCELCWIQRIFIYPQLLLFGLGLYKKDKSIVDYSIVSAVLGAITSIYHIYVEAGGTKGLECADPTSGGISCAVRYIYEFGYITMPSMALTLSLFIIVILINYKITSNIK